MDENEEIQSYIIDIRKPRVLDKGISNIKKFHGTKYTFKKLSDKRLRKPSELSLTKYYLPGGDALPTHAIKRDEFLLAYRRYEKQQNANRHKQRLGIKICDKYKIISTELRKRLHVEHPQDDVFGLTDIDEGFFKFINGRPLVHATSLYKSLKMLFLAQLRLRLEVGYRQDTVLNIDINYKKEQEIYDLTIQRLTDQAKYFDNFISEDYQKSMALLEKWEELKHRVNFKNLQLQNLAAEMFTITSRLIGLNYKYGLLRKYGRFLYYLSPPSWRMQNRDFARSVEIEARGFDYGNSDDEDTFTIMFEKMKSECRNQTVKPVIYFTHSKDLMDVFETLEKQQLHHFTYVTHMAPHAKILRKGLKSLRELIAQDSAVLANAIEGFESLITFYEERNDQLEAKVYKVLYGMFYENVGTLEVLKFFTHLEFCYEKVFFEKPLNVDIVTMGRALEFFYMDYTLRLEAMHTGNVQQAVIQCIEAEKQKQKRILEAARELRCFERLEHELLIAFEPAASATHTISTIPTKQKTRKMNQNKIQAKLSKCTMEENRAASLTEAELEYLRLFTDWVEHEDPCNYLQSFSVKQEERK